ncbi:hypothetical protein DESC_240069 [Desulfosarcina cetonica]|nr:hypothetical protein DESC_240069 [Desulfosarcina cetonica]
MVNADAFFRSAVFFPAFTGLFIEFFEILDSEGRPIGLDAIDKIKGGARGKVAPPRCGGQRPVCISPFLCFGPADLIKDFLESLKFGLCFLIDSHILSIAINVSMVSSNWVGIFGPFETDGSRRTEGTVLLSIMGSRYFWGFEPLDVR